MQRPFDFVIRPEQPEDSEAIAAVIREAFLDHPHSNNKEEFIVSALRAAGALFLSLAAERESVIAGHIAFSPVRISGGGARWYGLGPLAVGKRWQRAGIGTKLVKTGLESLREQGAEGCVVFGAPAFYGRFGFARDDRLRFPGYPPEYFLALPFGPLVPSGEIAYHPAFSQAL